MASEKRKAQSSDRPSKRAKAEQNPQTAKVPRKAQAPRQIKSTASDHPDSAKTPHPSTERRPAKESLLQPEDRSFPRGGANVLTPLEYKQIKVDAEQDVLFEQGGTQRVRDEYGDDTTEGQPAEGRKAPRKKQKTTSRRNDDANVKDDKSAVKIQGLSYKNLVKGTLVLGQVCKITSRDIALALPNNLTGYVPLTSISAKLNERVSDLLEQDDKSSQADDDDEQDQADIKLESLFHIGQYLRACVVSTSNDGDATAKSTRRHKRHIELSIEPKKTNSELSGSDFPVNTMLQASVRGVEDHGLVMDLGLEDETLKGFMSKKELGKTWDISQVQEGQVFLCCVTGLASDGRVFKLCSDASRIGETKKHLLASADTVNSFMPGTATEVLVTEVGRGGVVGKIMGLLDATCDIMHAGAGDPEVDFATKFKPGQKVVGRVICTFPDAEPKKVAISLLPHVVNYDENVRSTNKKVALLQPSQIVEEAKVIRVEPQTGLYVDLGVPGLAGFAHISRLSDDKLTTLAESSGPYRLNSSHRARVLGFNSVDGVYSVSLQATVLDRPFLQLEDVKVGQPVQVTVDKIIFGAKGVTGVVVDLCEGISGLIPEVHMADVRLQHPEKKFRAGATTKARVLNVDLDKRQVRLTTKKILLSDDIAMWKTYNTIKPGDETYGTVINILPNGAVLQFYGIVRAWLPVAEMSEAFVADPTQQFRVGQTVRVRAVSVDAQEQTLKVSCKEAKPLGREQEIAWGQIQIGELIEAHITEIGAESISLETVGSGFKAILRIGHLSDKSGKSSQAALKHLRIGQKLSDLLILQKMDARHVMVLSNKSSLVKAVKSAELKLSFITLVVGQEVKGFVRNIIPDGVFIELVNALVGFLPKSQLPKEKLALPSFGFEKDESLTSTVLSLDEAQKRFTLTLRDFKADKATSEGSRPSAPDMPVTNPVDGVSSSLTDFVLGMQTQAVILSVKDTQLNVQLADNIQGRIDVSEMFDDWTDISDRKHPLHKFKPKQNLSVRILGIHDARNHRFLPITHRSSRIPVFELTAKTKASIKASDVLTLEHVQPGSNWVAFVNNIADNCLWVNISPNVRGRIDLLDLSDEKSALDNLTRDFPVGSAIRVQVKHVDREKNRLDLVAASKADKPTLTFQELSIGMTLSCRVTKTTERGVIASLGGGLSGIIGLTELSDDYAEADPSRFSKNHIMRASVVDLDVSHERVYLTIRPSKLLSSALPVQDPAITSNGHIKIGTVLRGFVKVIQDHGLVVALGPQVDAFVRISDLSDNYVKDWASEFKVNQLVTGRILSHEATTNHVRMSLKASHADINYVAPISLADLEAGQFVTGKIRKVEDFGVFVDVDNTQPRVSGLCHRSQIADSKTVDVRGAYSEGDKVKAKILSIDLDKRRISFGLKASYFADVADEEEAEDESDERIAIDAGDSDGGVDLSDMLNGDEENEDDDVSDSVASEFATSPTGSANGLQTAGFDWTADAMDVDEQGSGAAESDADTAAIKKRKRRHPTIYTDKTGDLDSLARSNVDFERLLLTSPHSSDLWVQYMAFQLQLGETQSARDIGRRALRTIHIREQDEKLAVWTALLNLEVSYGTDEELEEVFAEACRMQDSYVVHERMAEIWTQAGRFDRADKVYEAMIGKKDFRAATQLWLTYATFLFDKVQEAGRARALLSRALQSVRETDKRLLTAKFAALEWKTSTGDVERGRTIYEGLVDQWPKWTTVWDMWVDLEKQRIQKASESGAAVAKEGDDAEALGRVRSLFERMTQTKMKKRRARTLFKRWLEFEEHNPHREERHLDRVKALAKEYVDGSAGNDEDDE